MSKRAFDGKIKAWRKQLHRWDVLDAIIETNTINNTNCHTGRSDGGSNIITTHSGNIPYSNINSNSYNTKKTKFDHTNTIIERGSSSNNNIK